MVDLKESSARGADRKRLRAPRVPTGCINVGVIEPSYGMERVSYALTSEAFHHSIGRVLPLRLLDRASNFYQATPFVLARGYDLIHAWNTTPRNGPFVTTIEMEFPRLFGAVSPNQWDFVLDRVASDDCRGLWTLSDAANRWVTREFQRLNRPELAEKLDVFRGAVAERPIAPDFTLPRDPSSPLRVLFVGGDGLRKGLYPLTAAIEKVIKAGGNVHLTIVGAFTTESYTTPGIVFDRPEVEKTVRSAPWATVMGAISNSDVRALMDSHDVLAFPTFDESLGWVPMEAAMSGLPTIATNIFALPEFVIDGKTGWSVPIQLNDDLRWHFNAVGGDEGKAAFLETEAQIEAGLVRVLSDILERPEIVADRGQAAYALAQDRYRPDVAAERLASLYSGAVR